MSRFLALVLFLTAMLPLAASAEQTFRVLVLDGLDGKPQSGVVVDYFCDTGYDTRKSVRTGKTGMAEVPFSCGNGVNIQLSVNSSDTPTDKWGCGGGAYATLQQILLIGVMNKPNDDGFWCPAGVSRKLKPVPGQVILFIKRPSWLQNHWPTGPDG